MDDLPTFHSPKDYLDLARSADATPGQLRALARTPYSFVWQAVAENPATPPDVLRSLLPQALDGGNATVLLTKLIRNPATPVAALESAPELILPHLHDRDGQRAFEAGVALSQREDIPEPVLIRLVDDPRTTTEFRKVIARRDDP